MDKAVEYFSHVDLLMNALLLTPTQVRACFGAWIFLILSHVSGAAAAIEPALRIACVGDSITAGARVEAELESYPAQLSQQLGEGYEVRNFGLGGATLLRSGTPHVWSELSKVDAFLPDGVIVALGTNDTVDGGRGNWSRIGSFEADARALIRHLLDLPSSPWVLMVGPTAMVLETPELSAERLANLRERLPRLEQLRGVLRGVCDQMDDPRLHFEDLGPVLRRKPHLLTSGDGVHPNAEGYRAMATQVAFWVRDLSADQWCPIRSDQWHGYERVHVALGTQKAWVVRPLVPAPGRPWIWRARFPFFHAEMDHEILGHGFHIAYVDVANLYGNEQAMALGDELYEWLTRRHQLNPRPVMEGVSRGGLFVYQWAGLHPQKVAAIYADTPVCDPRSWPGGLGSGRGSKGDWQRLLGAYGVADAHTWDSAFPVFRHAPSLASERIPMLSVISENDVIVPPSENTLLLRKKVQSFGHDIELIRVKEGTYASGGHHFTHPRPDRVVRFFLEYGNPQRR